MMPADLLLPRETDLLGASSDGFLVNLPILNVVALPGWEGPRDDDDLPLL
jgi:hypothetical protein